MPKYTVTDPQTGRKVTLTGDSAPNEQELESIFKSISVTKPIPTTPQEEQKSFVQHVGQNIGNEAAGFLRGAGSIGSTILWPADKLVDTINNDRNGLPSRNEERRQSIDSMLEKMGANPDSGFYKGGKITGEVLGTIGVGGTIAKAAAPIAAKVPALAPIVKAVGSNGMSSAGLKGLSGLTTRATGGATAGGVSAGMVDPESATTGAAIGGGIPIVGAVGKYVGGAAWSAIKHFLKSGQVDAALKTLLSHAENPEAALAAIKAQAPELVAGSTPTTAAVTGDVGLSGLQRTMQSTPNVFNGFGDDLTLNSIKQNAARNASLEEIAGSAGKIEVAKAAREAATGKMREDALNAAGNIPVSSVTKTISQKLNDPENANPIVQSALNSVKTVVDKWTAPDGTINARALYNGARKHINDIAEGKITLDNSNAKYAASEISSIKSAIDDAIESAINKPAGAGLATIKPTGREVNPLNIQGAQNAAQEGASDISFKKYLKTFSDMSKPIDQMEIIQTLLTKARTGTIRGNDYVLSGNALNRIIKNDGDELAKVLSPDQMQRLRNVASDASAEEQAMNVGRSVGSNTMQNMNSGMMLKGLVGQSLGGNAGVRTLGRALDFIYKIPNEETATKLSDLMLNPNSARAAVLNYEKAQAKSQQLKNLLSPSTSAIVRVAPSASAQDQAAARRNYDRK